MPTALVAAHTAHHTVAATVVAIALVVDPDGSDDATKGGNMDNREEVIIGWVNGFNNMCSRRVLRVVRDQEVKKGKHGEFKKGWVRYQNMIISVVKAPGYREWWGFA